MYLVGPWAEVTHDPGLWGFEGAAITHFVVRVACLRLLRLRAASAPGSQYAPRKALAPRLWDTTSDNPNPSAVQAIAARQTQQFLAMLPRGAGRDVRPRVGATRTRAADVDLSDLYHAPWMDAAPPRELPAARAAQRRQEAAAAAAAGGSRAAGDDDCADALAGGGEQRKPWIAVWRRAFAKSLPRALRCFAWLLLHAALPCGGALVPFLQPGADGVAEAACCGCAACVLAGPSAPSEPPPAVGARRPSPQAALAQAAASWPVETLLHALLECPAVRPAVVWLADLWPRVSDGDAAPPLTPAVWLQDSPAGWRPRFRGRSRPSRESEALWAALRLSLLAAAWRLRCRRRVTGQQFSAADVVDATIDSVERLVRAEFAATSDLTELAGTSSSWFPRNRPPVPLDEFVSKWCRGRVIAEAGESGGRSWMRLRFSACRLSGAARAAAVAAAASRALLCIIYKKEASREERRPGPRTGPGGKGAAGDKRRKNPRNRQTQTHTGTTRPTGGAPKRQRRSRPAKT
ncbi:MAG: hypothetical protein ACKOQ4_00285 [Mycobacterium sp.]